MSRLNPSSHLNPLNVSLVTPRYEDEDLNEWCCSDCSYFLYRPINLSCLHLFCEQCVKDSLMDNGDGGKIYECPVCGVPTDFSVDENGSILLPINQQINFKINSSFPVRCPNECSTVIPCLGMNPDRFHLKNHLDQTCPLEPVICDDCHRQFPRNTTSDHFAKECTEFEVECDYCGKCMTRKEYYSHIITPVSEGKEEKKDEEDNNYCIINPLQLSPSPHSVPRCKNEGYCPNRDRGCTEIISTDPSSVLAHCPACPYNHRTVPCINESKGCKEKIDETLLTDHCDNKCLYRDVYCSYCDKTMTEQERLDHQLTDVQRFCINQTICPHCDWIGSDDLFDDHLEACEKGFIACSICQKKIRRDSVANHNREAEDGHRMIELINKKLSALNNLFVDTKNDIANIRNEVGVLKSEMSVLQKKIEEAKGGKEESKKENQTMQSINKPFSPLRWAVPLKVIEAAIESKERFIIDRTINDPVRVRLFLSMNYLSHDRTDIGLYLQNLSPTPLSISSCSMKMYRWTNNHFDVIRQRNFHQATIETNKGWGFNDFIRYDKVSPDHHWLSFLPPPSSDDYRLFFPNESGGSSVINQNHDEKYVFIEVRIN